MIQLSHSLQKRIFRRWLVSFAFTAYAIGFLPLLAEDTDAGSTSEIPGSGAMANQTPSANATTAPASVAAVDSPASDLSLHAGGSALRDTGAGETTVTVAQSSAPNVPPAQTPFPGPAPASVPPSAAPSPNAMVNLVNLLVNQHVITKEAGDGLIKQAEQEADTARAQIASTQATADRALTLQTAQPPGPTPAPAPTASDDDVRVTYVPDAVKNQIRDEVTQEVLKQDREENLTAKDTTPDWVKRFRVSGDVRVRYEGDFYPDGNSVGSFTNFNSINTGSGFVVGSLFPRYNVDQDRDRFRLRARIGAEIDLGDGFTAGMRVGTGADNSPVTENQTLGAANSGQGGNFSKYGIWLDRGFIKYELGSRSDLNLSFTVGRFDNPFFHTSMIWSDDVGFDGAVLQAKYKVADGVTPFFVAGGFPVFDTDLNFGTNSNEAGNGYSSEDKYLLASQLGVNWAINKDFSVKVAGAYYYFSDVEGKVSDPIALDADGGDTDDSRPAFAQSGNTYIALRNYQDPSNPTHVGETQYFGLATPFHELALTGQADYSGFDPFHVWLNGEFVKNLAFERNSILNNGSPDFAPGPVNNLTDSNDPTSFAGGDFGWLVKLNLGKVALENRWDWNVNLSYRYVQSDATVDGFTDSDFGGALAGTNLKGYIIGGNLALSPRVWASLRWMSADAVAGPTYKNDLIQVDLNAKF